MDKGYPPIEGPLPPAPDPPDQPVRIADLPATLPIPYYIYPVRVYGLDWAAMSDLTKEQTVRKLIKDIEQLVYKRTVQEKEKAELRNELNHIKRQQWWLVAIAVCAVVYFFYRVLQIR